MTVHQTTDKGGVLRSTEVGERTVIQAYAGGYSFGLVCEDQDWMRLRIVGDDLVEDAPPVGGGLHLEQAFRSWSTRARP